MPYVDDYVEAKFVDQIPNLIDLSTIKPKPTQWLWRNMIPSGCLTLLSGDPGIGKSYILSELAACITGYSSWPELFPEFPNQQEPGRVLWFNAEDSLEQTISQRLMRAGIDASKGGKIFFDDGWHSTEGDRGFSSLSNLDLFRKQLALTRPVAVFIDTLDAYLGDVNNNQATTIRTVLTPITKLAEEFECAIIGVRHLSKGAQEKALYRGAGSIALTALARSELFFGFDPDDDNEDLDARKRVIAQVKCSLGRRSPSIAYRIVSDEDDTRQARFVWDGLNTNSAEDLVAPTSRDSEEDKSAIDEACAFLHDRLAGGIKEDAEVIKREAKANDISYATLRRAKKKMNVKSTQVQQENGKRRWLWFTDAQVP